MFVIALRSYSMPHGRRYSGRPNLRVKFTLSKQMRPERNADPIGDKGTHDCPNPHTENTPTGRVGRPLAFVNVFVPDRHCQAGIQRTHRLWITISGSPGRDC